MKDNIEAQLEIFEYTKNKVNTFFDIEASPYGVCFPMNTVAMNILETHGIETILQAGSLSFPFKEAIDNSDNCISYNWNNNDTIDILETIKSHDMPEMHIWLIEKLTNDIIDFSLFKLPDALHTMGIKWETELPPDYVWGNTGKAIYQEVPEATALAQMIYEITIGVRSYEV